jgi:hypothetical protein
LWKISNLRPLKCLHCRKNFKSETNEVPTLQKKLLQLLSGDLWNTNAVIILIVALCILKIHWVLHTNKCTNCILYISLKLSTLKHFHCSYMFR